MRGRYSVQQCAGIGGGDQTGKGYGGQRHLYLYEGKTINTEKSWSVYENGEKLDLPVLIQPVDR